MKLGFALWVEDDFQVPLLLFVECWAGAFELLLLAFRVAHLDGAAVLELDVVLVDGAVGQRVDAKTGAGVVDLKLINGGAGVVHDGDVDEVGPA